MCIILKTFWNWKFDSWKIYIPLSWKKLEYRYLYNCDLLWNSRSMSIYRYASQKRRITFKVCFPFSKYSHFHCTYLLGSGSVPRNLSIWRYKSRIYFQLINDQLLLKVGAYFVNQSIEILNEATAKGLLLICLWLDLDFTTCLPCFETLFWSMEIL